MSNETISVTVTYQYCKGPSIFSLIRWDIVFARTDDPQISSLIRGQPLRKRALSNLQTQKKNSLILWILR